MQLPLQNPGEIFKQIKSKIYLNMLNFGKYKIKTIYAIAQM